MHQSSPRTTTAERFVEATLELIAERGGSQDVNLREISRRVGCAHTNVYNYYDSFDDLLWEAFRRTLVDYAAAIVDGLDDSMTRLDYFQRLVGNLATYPQEHPGLYRFIGSDPIDIDAIPADILDTVSRVKGWLFAAFRTASGPRISGTDADDFCNITYGYIDGETFNLNAVRLFEMLTKTDGYSVDPDGPPPDGYPQLELEVAPP